MDESTQKFGVEFMPHFRFHNGEGVYNFQRFLVTAACGQRIINIGQVTESCEQRDNLTRKTLMISLSIVFLVALAYYF